MARVQIVEVGPRDGLQNEKLTIPVEARISFIEHLASCGLKRIEVGAFVSPKWVPQMENSDQVIRSLFARKTTWPKDVQFSALVPNVKGMMDALETPIPEIAIFGASSETFSKHNINCSIAESLERFQAVTALAKKHKRRVRGYLSVAFGCPYEGNISESRVVELVKAYLKLGVYEISVGDTIGVATPKQVRSLLAKLKKHVPLKKIALHLHDTRGTALANVLAGLEMGVRVFDSSYGGLGGCPYARGASGNLATEDLVYMLEGMGFETGVQLDRLLSYGEAITREVGHALPSKTLQSGLPKVTWNPRPKASRKR